MSGKRSEIFLLEVVGSNLGGGRRGSICGLSEEIVGYTRPRVLRDVLVRGWGGFWG